VVQAVHLMSEHILLFQNDVVAATSVIDALCQCSDASFQVEWVRSCADGLEKLEGVAAILVDLHLSDSDGIDTFDRMFHAAPRIPILILASYNNEKIAKLAVQRGAQDYLFMSRLDAFQLPKTVRSMIERAAHAESLFVEGERAQVTLNSIGDAVVSTNASGQITYLNAIAEDLTGWSLKDAMGRPLESVFQIIDVATRQPAANPMTRAVQDDNVSALPPNCVLIRRDGTESAIEDSVAPIHDRQGAVAGAVMVFRDVSVSRALTLKMSYLAQHDSLTDLPNRVLLNDRLSEALTLSSRYRRKLAILFLDLDHFKHINDSLGHLVGDLLLQSVARRLFGCVRSSDTVARQGGDEFVIVLWELRHAEDAAGTATKILDELRKPHYIKEHELYVTGSIGIVTYPDDGVDVETLIKKADSAMYHAKESGRDRFQFSRSEMRAKAIEREALQAGLCHAIERRELVLHYQSKLNLLTGKIVGAEALMRWRHPQLGLIPPGRFLSIAEDCGLVVPIGRWVLLEACHQARAWQAAGDPLSIAVNISPAELRAPDFVSGVSEILKETGLEPRYLELELAETALIEDARSVSDMLKELKEVGVLLALDGFGTGNLSLTRLRSFSIDTLKIDRSFVGEMATDKEGISIVTAMIGMGKNLQMQVVAEGVETRQQFEMLKEQGCPQAQGYYFSRPMPAEEFGRMMKCKPSSTTSA
jgi:diguanylate cyclase (GGDEF)-like protein/PAS domain S-box-containing protein